MIASQLAAANLAADPRTYIDGKDPLPEPSRVLADIFAADLEEKEQRMSDMQNALLYIGKLDGTDACETAKLLRAVMDRSSIAHVFQEAVETVEEEAEIKKRQDDIPDHHGLAVDFSGER
jgi:hypothetical protein